MKIEVDVDIDEIVEKCKKNMSSSKLAAAVKAEVDYQVRTKVGVAINKKLAPIKVDDLILDVLKGMDFNTLIKSRIEEKLNHECSY